MPGPEIDAVITMLRESPPFGGDDINTMRAGMREATAAMPLPEDVRFERIEAGRTAVPAEWAIAPNARDDRVVVYLHGGGYVMGGIIGHGDAFIARDPNGIRPCFWYEDEEVVVVVGGFSVLDVSRKGSMVQLSGIGAAYVWEMKKFEPATHTKNLMLKRSRDYTYETVLGSVRKLRGFEYGRSLTEKEYLEELDAADESGGAEGPPSPDALGAPQSPPA